MSTPFRFDDSVTERSGALASAAIGVTQASIDASTKAARGDASIGLVGIGSAGSPSMNPLNIGASPAPTFVQPATANPDASKIANVPTPRLDAMGVSTTPTNYIQPNNFTPAARPGGTVSAKNPMGL
jgi:hypothetical protein